MSLEEKKKGIAHDRQHCKVLVVCPRGSTSTQIRHALKNLGFVQISAAPSHVTALDRAKTRAFTHIIFDAKETDMPVINFVEQVVEQEEDAVMVAISEQPQIDDVFGMLKAGARGFLVPPFTVDMIEEVLVRATDGPTISEGVLSAPDRNAAFASVILNNLYKCTTAMRQAREFPTAEREVAGYTYAFRDSVEMGYLFCEGAEEDFREVLMDACIERAKDAATRLGRLRKKLKKKRVDEDDPPEAGAEEAGSAA